MLWTPLLEPIHLDSCVTTHAKNALVDLFANINFEINSASVHSTVNKVVNIACQHISSEFPSTDQVDWWCLLASCLRCLDFESFDIQPMWVLHLYSFHNLFFLPLPLAYCVLMREMWENQSCSLGFSIKVWTHISGTVCVILFASWYHASQSPCIASVFNHTITMIPRRTTCRLLN